MFREHALGQVTDILITNYYSYALWLQMAKVKISCFTGQLHVMFFDLS